uniref:Retrovirus-related Pol polyprotein from transposon TNT 1-94 n=1 Tax=Quercus lobata TaxID=97700 RepID=A0A7N2LJ68_QUELO
MAEGAGKASGIEKFDGKNFAYWRMQIEDYLYGRKLHLPLLGTKPEAMKAKEWALLDRQVLGVIKLTLSRSVAHNVVKENTTADLMKALSGIWEAMRMAVNNSTRKEKLKYNDIRDLILAEEIRKRDAGETSGSSSALNLETRGRGASFHITPHREIIQNYVAGDFGKVYLADGSALDVVGHAILFVGGTWNVTKGARVLARGKKTGTLYMTSSLRDTVAVAEASTDTSLWHCRLSHMSVKGMKMLLSRGKLPELKSIDFDMCESCILGKRKNVSFLKTDRTPKAEKLELVHTDLWGPSPVASLGGSRYYITFIDDSSRKGIRMEKTIPGTAQQNGVAERMNRTLNERARSISKLDAKSKIFFFIGYGDEKFGYRFWDEQNKKIIRNENSSKWELAMKDEMDSLLGNQTWELTELPIGKKTLHNKWVYRIKNEHDGSKRYKARLVIKGFQQKEGIDYTEIFSLVMKMSTIRLVLGMVAAENLHLEQLDVKTAFLHGDLEEDIYMIQPEGFIVQGQENLVCKLRKSLYGLKQTPRQWYKKFDSFMQIRFKRCEADHCCYVKSFDNSYIILLLYVDDMLIVGSSIEEINNLKKQLSKQFAMKDLGAAKQILGMRIIRDKANCTLKLSQSEYVKKVLNRPDIVHAVGVVSKFMSRPGKQHWEAVKWILRYLKGSSDTFLCFTGTSLKLQGYVDANFTGDIDSRKSTIGFVFTLGGTAISWASNLQKIVTLSTTKAEYVAATEAGKEMIWLHGFLDELKKYHFIQYLVEDKLVILEKICGSKNPTDMLTKGVTIEKLKLCAVSVGLLA